MRLQMVNSATYRSDVLKFVNDID